MNCLNSDEIVSTTDDSNPSESKSSDTSSTSTKKTCEYTPVSLLSPYFSRAKWKILCKVVEYTKRSFTTSRGPCSLLETLLMDVQGDIITAKFWNSAADKFSTVLSKDNIFAFHNGRINVANRRYNTTPHSYELTFEADAVITQVTSGDNFTETQGSGTNASGDSSDLVALQAKFKSVPIKHKTKFNFETLRDIKTSSRELPFPVDVLGVVHSWTPPETIIAKHSNETSRQVLRVVDSSECLLEVTLWERSSELKDVDLNNTPVIAFKNLQIRSWRGRVGSTTTLTKIVLNHESEESKTLQEWYSNYRDDVNFLPLTEPRFSDASSSNNMYSQNVASLQTDTGTKKLTSLCKIMKDMEGLPESEAIFYNSIVYISKWNCYNKDNEFTGIYMACPQCKKKVNADNASIDELFRSKYNLKDSSKSDPLSAVKCENCNSSPPEVLHKYMMSATMTDHTVGRCISRAFNETCESLLRQVDSFQMQMMLSYPYEDASSLTSHKFMKTASEKQKNYLSQKIDNLTNQDVKNRLMDFDSLWEPIRVNIRARKESYNGNVRTNIVLLNGGYVDANQHAKWLLSEIQNILNVDSFESSKLASSRKRRSWADELHQSSLAKSEDVHSGSVGSIKRNCNLDITNDVASLFSSNNAGKSNCHLNGVRDDFFE